MTSPGFRAFDRVIGDVYAFTDAGRTWNLAVLGCQPAGTGLNLHSYGGGFDILPGQRITGALTWAKVLDSATDLASVASSGCPASGPATLSGQSRVLFFVRGTF
jgi:hypothetical protein